MPTQADTDRIRAANRGLVRLAQRDLQAFWASLDLARPEQARDALLEFLPTLTATYGEAAASVAADWYDDLRAAEGVAGRFTAEMAAPIPVEAVQARARFGAQHLFTDQPLQTLAFLSGAVQKYVLQPGRDTITRSTARDPQASGWQRIVRGGGCDFCLMLAGRGGVYKETTVRFASHGDCNCAAAPVWDRHAPEVDVMAYVASQRMGALRARAAAGDESAQEQLAAHEARVRDWIAANLH